MAAELASTRTVLVTGGNGYLGRQLIMALLDRGDRVVSVVRPSASQPPSGVGRIDWSGDAVKLRDSVAEWRPDAAVHLAAVSIGDHRTEDISPMVESSFTLGVQLLDALSAAGSRGLVRADTFWQHDSRTGEPVASSLYAAIKTALDPVAEFYAVRRGLASVSLELFDVYGPDDHRSRLIDTLVSLDPARSLAMSPGQQVMDLVHVSDVVAAFLVALDGIESGTLTGSTRYSVSTRDRRTLRDVVALVERTRETGLSIDWGARPYRECDVMVPCESCASLPGWAPRVTLSQGIADLVARATA